MLGIFVYHCNDSSENFNQYTEEGFLVFLLIAYVVNNTFRVSLKSDQLIVDEQETIIHTGVSCKMFSVHFV
jgi:hypothetical protein